MKSKNETKPHTYQTKSVGADGQVHYSQDEHLMWQKLYGSQCRLAEKYMVNEFIEGLDYLQLPDTAVPQCLDVSTKIKLKTGWQMKPVPALLGYEKFFAMLANQCFPAASFIRNSEDFAYVKEPDIFHEIFGHAPLLIHPQVAKFSQHIGQLGCEMTAEDWPWLARLYWFTIEFGLIKQASNGVEKAVPYGAALASSATEMVYASNSKVPKKVPFDAVAAMTTPSIFGVKHAVYYVIDSFDHLLAICDSDLVAAIAEAKQLKLVN